MEIMHLRYWPAFFDILLGWCQVYYSYIFIIVGPGSGIANKLC